MTIVKKLIDDSLNKIIRNEFFIFLNTNFSNIRIYIGKIEYTDYSNYGFWYDWELIL